MVVASSRRRVDTQRYEQADQTTDTARGSMAPRQRRGSHVEIDNSPHTTEESMGKQGRDILQLDVDKLLEMLNGALAEEWLAYYQYWIGARVMEGPMRSDIEQELLLHADQELNHAVMVVERIDQLGGTPLLSPADWMKHSSCDYEAPEDPYIEKVLEQNLNGERCAIRRYDELAKFTYGRDHSTYKLATTILEEELEHEHDIEDWLADINRIRENLMKLQK
jgi:bacterioferritin